MRALCSIGPRQITASLGRDQQADRHDLHARRPRPARCCSSTICGRSCGAEQVRDARPVDVGVHQADLAAGPAQPIGQQAAMELLPTPLCPSRRPPRSWPPGRFRRAFPACARGRRLPRSRGRSGNRRRRCSVSSACVWAHNGADHVVSPRMTESRRRPIAGRRPVRVA